MHILEHYMISSGMQWKKAISYTSVDIFFSLIASLSMLINFLCTFIIASAYTVIYVIGNKCVLLNLCNKYNFWEYIPLHLISSLVFLDIYLLIFQSSIKTMQRCFRNIFKILIKSLVPYLSSTCLL